MIRKLRFKLSAIVNEYVLGRKGNGGATGGLNTVETSRSAGVVFNRKVIR